MEWYVLALVLTLCLVGFICRYFVVKRFAFSMEDMIFKGKAGWLKLSLLFLSFLFLVFSFSNPLWKTKIKTHNYLAVIDITQSMGCLDYFENGKEMSRLQMVKKSLKNLLEELPQNSRLGLAVFAGTPVYSLGTDFFDVKNKKALQFKLSNSPSRNVVLPITTPLSVGDSRKELEGMIEEINLGWMWSGGSPITSSLFRISELIQDRDLYGEKIIVIFLTDGEKAGGYYAAGETMPKGGEFGDSQVYFVGVGSLEKIPVPALGEQEVKAGKYKTNYYLDKKVLKSSLDEEHLKKISSVFKAPYKKIKSSDDLRFLAHEDKFRIIDEYRTEHLDWMFSLVSMVLVVLCFII